MKNLFSLFVLALATSVLAQEGSGSSSPSASATESSSPTATGASVSGASESSSSSSSPSSTQTGTVPSGSPQAAPKDNAPTGSVSASCGAFLAKLNTAPELNACLGPLLSATSAATGASGAALTKALDGLCNAPGCSDTMIRTQLTHFKDECKQELTGSNPVDIVRKTYDTLYVMNPLRDAVCSKDGADYCVAKLKTSTLPAITAAIAKAKSGLYGGSRTIGLPDSQIVIGETPNTDVWRSSSVANMFILPDLPAEALCTPCTSSILKAYSEFGVPHALGAAKSPMLGGQLDLWKAINDKCDASFSKEIFDASVLAVQRTASAANLASSLSGITISLLAVAGSAWLAF